MVEKTVEKAFEITKTVKTYIAKDGQEFNNMDECITYESELDLNCYADKYKMKFIEVPVFICSDEYVHGISFYFPKDGNEDEVARLLAIFQNYDIRKQCGRWEIYCARNLSNVRDSDFEIKMPLLNKGENYIFCFYWKTYNDDWDDFYNEVFSKEKALAKLKDEIKSFEEIFGTKF